MDNLEKSIFRTITWFDIFNYPLTVYEIWKWLWMVEKNKPRVENLKNVLEKSDFLKKLIKYKDGFYFLMWRDQIVKKRKQRYILTEKKYKKLLPIVEKLARIPFVEAIVIATGLSYSNTKEKDDIDLFIITAAKRIWFVRFFSILILKILRARPTPAKKQDKFCLNFFITGESLNLKNICLPREDDLPDIYFIYWLAWLCPVYDNGVWKEFTQANDWLKNYLPNYHYQILTNERKIILKSDSLFFKNFCERVFSKIFGNFLEQNFSWLQRKIMPQRLKDLANQSTSVIINDQVLKFHDKDKREEYRTEFKNNVLKVKDVK